MQCTFDILMVMADSMTSAQVQVVNSPGQPVIQIDALNAFIGVAVVLVGMGIAWGTLRNSVKTVSTLLKDQIVPDLKDVRERFAVVEDRVDTLWKDKFAPAHSPRQLNERGTAILNTSGIKEIIERNREKLLGIIRKANATNPYDAEKVIIDTVAKLPEHCPEVIDDLKTGAFKSGADLDSVLYVGGIHLRNLIFNDLGFTLDDLDKPAEVKSAARRNAEREGN